MLGDPYLLSLPLSSPRFRKCRAQPISQSATTLRGPFIFSYPGTFSSHPRHILDTSWPHPRHILDTSWATFGIQGMWPIPETANICRRACGPWHPTMEKRCTCARRGCAQGHGGKEAPKRRSGRALPQRAFFSSQTLLSSSISNNIQEYEK